MITWKITNMERIAAQNDKTDIVCNVHYYAYDSNEDGWFGYAFGNCFLDLTNLEGFNNYNSLTEDQVVQWVKEWHDPEQLQAIENGIQQAIIQRRYTRRLIGLPWVSGE